MFISHRDIGVVISAGETTKMYTLRVLQEGEMVTQGVAFQCKQTTYLQNLSTDLETAKVKAAKIGALMGLQLIDAMTTDRTLFEIERNTPEVTERLRVEREQKSEAKEQARRQERHDWVLGNIGPINQGYIDAGQFFMGKHAGRSIAQVVKFDPSYIEFLLSDVPSLEELGGFYTSIAQLQSDLIRKMDLVIEHKESNHVGAEKDKLVIDVTCTNKTGFASDYGWVDRYTCVDAEGNTFLIDYTGCAWEMEVFGEYQVRGTVKSHGDFREVKQTKLTRCKVITAEEAAQAVVKVKAPVSKKSTSTKGPSKKARAIEIYFEHGGTKSRGEIIEMFMEQLAMTKTGASTYYATAKKAVEA